MFMEQNNVELMRIAGITESEVAWSNIYAYYMNPRNEPVFQRIIEYVINLILNYYGFFSLDEYVYS